MPDGRSGVALRGEVQSPVIPKFERGAPKIHCPCEEGGVLVKGKRVKVEAEGVDMIVGPASLSRGHACWDPTSSLI